MRRLLATMPNCAPTLLALFVIPLSADAALSDSLGSATAAPATPAALAGTSNDVVVYEPNPSPGSEPACAAPARTTAEVAEARAYVIETASPGFTMTLQGAELAIGRLHPEFVVRLANAIREARSAGLPSAGVFSAYRPPAFGVGGFSDKFNSLHTYGLAVDMHGIGRPGSPEAQLWHETAARNGVVCPYGPRDRAEWNPCQPTSVKMIVAQNPLRETVSSAGPYDLDSMFEAGNAMIADMASAADSLSRAAATPVHVLEASAKSVEPTVRVAAPPRTKRSARVALARVSEAKAARVAAKSASPGKTERVAAKSGGHAKTEQVATKSTERAKREHVAAKPAEQTTKSTRRAAKSAEHAKSERVAAKSAQDAKPTQRKGRSAGAEESHPKAKAKGA